MVVIGGNLGYFKEVPIGHADTYAYVSTARRPPGDLREPTPLPDGILREQSF